MTNIIYARYEGEHLAAPHGYRKGCLYTLKYTKLSFMRALLVGHRVEIRRVPSVNYPEKKTIPRIQTRPQIYKKISDFEKDWDIDRIVES